MYASFVRSLVLSAVVLGCGGPQDPATEDLTAAEHEAQAEDEDHAAEIHEARADQPPRHGSFDRSATEDALAAAHREHADAHRQRAAQLRAFQQAECGDVAADERASCPLLLGLDAVEEIPGGAKLTFASTVDVDSVLGHIRCHLAYAAAQGTEGLDHCALYVPGTSAEAEGGAILLTTDQEEHTADLRQRISVQAP